MRSEQGTLGVTWMVLGQGSLGEEILREKRGQHLALGYSNIQLLFRGMGVS